MKLLKPIKTDFNFMKGILKKTVDDLVVEYFDDFTEKIKSLPLYNSNFSKSDVFKHNIPDVGTEVDFDIVDEFTHPYLFDNLTWGDGFKCAKIKS